MSFLCLSCCVCGQPQTTEYSIHLITWGESRFPKVKHNILLSYHVLRVTYRSVQRIRKCWLYASAEQFVEGVKFSLDNCTRYARRVQCIGKQRAIVLYLVSSKQISIHPSTFMHICVVYFLWTSEQIFQARDFLLHFKRPFDFVGTILALQVGKLYGVLSHLTVTPLCLSRRQYIAGVFRV